MQYVKTERFGKFLIPKEIEDKMKALTDEELVLAYLKERFSNVKPGTQQAVAGLQKMVVNVEIKPSHFDLQIYYLQVLEDRKIISGKETLFQIDKKLKNMVAQTQINLQPTTC